MPFPASIRTKAALAVDDPVTILRVNSKCPGESAMINFLTGVEKYLYATSIVIPSSLSLFRPSVKKARFKSSVSMSVFISSSWFLNIALLSRSSLPISVDLPLSTEPMVVNLNKLLLYFSFVPIAIS